MSFLSDIGDKITKKLRGELVTDLGTLPSEWPGLEVSLAIRQYPGQRPYLEVKVVRTMPGVSTESFEVACSRERSDYLEKVAREMRRQMDAPVP